MFLIPYSILSALTVFDSAVEGKYKETSAGRIIYVTDSAKNADNSTKNRTYYSDTTPAVPEGGHRVGDLWYKISLTDGCYYTYRWNGTAWQEINVYVSKSRIEQTDSRITSVVEKTGINSLGTGETLYSKINQTASDIRLEVSKIQVGGRNYALKTSNEWCNMISLSNIANQCLFAYKVLADNWQADDVITVSYDYKFQDVVKNANPYLALQGSGNVTGWTNSFTSNSILSRVSGTGEIRVSYSFTLSAQQVTNQYFNINIRHDNMTGMVCIKNMMIEKGTKPSDWTPAPEDIGEIAGSSLTLTDNKISLASKTIELKGTTIAKAIEAEDLKVGSRTGASALEVLKNGTFYAKGSSGTDSSLIIDSQNQSIEISSPYTGNSESTTYTPSTIKMSASQGSIRLQNSEGRTNVSAEGISVNGAGLNQLPGSSGMSQYGAINAYGKGNMTGYTSMSEWSHDTDFIAGVIGRAYNSATSNKAAAFGGWFTNLKANGLVLNTKFISYDTYTYLNKTDSLVISRNTANPHYVYLPTDCEIGTVIFLKNWYTGVLRVMPRYPNKLFDDSSENANYDLNNGMGAICFFIKAPLASSSTETGVWLISTMKWVGATQ